MTKRGRNLITLILPIEFIVKGRNNISRIGNIRTLKFNCHHILVDLLELKTIIIGVGVFGMISVSTIHYQHTIDLVASFGTWVNINIVEGSLISVGWSELEKILILLPIGCREFK